MSDTPFPLAPSPAPASAPAPATDIDALLGTTRPRRGRRWLSIAALLVVFGAIGLGAWHLFGPGGGSGTAADAPRYVTQPVTRGAVTLTVNANGTLQPTRSVAIGSELSGTVARVLVDVNDRVKKGQLLVELDTAKLADQVARSLATLASAQAKLASARVAVKDAEASLARLREVQKLSGGRVPAQAELATAEATRDKALADVTAAQAAVADAQAALSTDRTNLGKAAIRSPIDGVVLTRAVDPGNAVAASLQAVTLFTIAEDLRALQLNVNVDEADVGAVALGQRASFTVAAYAGRNFPAKVTRVAFGSTTTDNVVTYTTTMAVDNADLALRPGMTATATIVATEHPGVLLVPPSALRFTPTGAKGAAAAPGGAASGSSGSILSKLMPRPPNLGGRRGGAGGGNTTTEPGAKRQVWLLKDGRAVAVPVTVGISDGRRTEVSGEGLAEGDAVIVDQRSSGG